MNAFDLIRSDHHKVNAVFDRLQETTAQQVDERATLVTQLARLLRPHMAAEEQLFYPLVHNGHATDELRLQAEEEHHAARLILTEVETIVPADEHFQAKVRVLRAMITVHIAEEEGALFAIVRPKLSQAEAELLGTRMSAVEQQFMASMDRAVSIERPEAA